MQTLAVGSLPLFLSIVRLFEIECESYHLAMC